MEILDFLARSNPKRDLIACDLAKIRQTANPAFERSETEG